MEFKGTKEKFIIDGKIIFADDYFQGYICIMSDAYSEQITLANAKLIAKAPEMFETLKSILEMKEIDLNKIEQLLTKITQ